MKKLLIINHYAGVPKYGMRYRHYHIAKELIKKNVEVCIVASSFSHLRSAPKCKAEIIDEIHFRWIKTPSYKKFGLGRLLNMLLFSIKLFFNFKKLPFVPDTIIISSPSPFAILNAIHLKRKYKAKLIYEIRDIWPMSIIELKGISVKNPLILFLDWLDTKGIKSADYIMSPLHNIRQYIVEKGFEKPIVILPNGILEMHDPRALNSNDTSNNSSNVFKIGYGGTLGDSNSIMNLLNAALLLKRKPNIKFEIVGDGEKMNDIKEFIKLHQLENSVSLYGRVDKETLFTILGKCDILYKGNPAKNLYKYGVSSIKMVEYLLLKKPILDASFGVDIIEKSKCGLVVEYENSEALVEGILKFQEMDSNDLKIMGENGYEFVRKNYLYKNLVEKLLLALK